MTDFHDRITQELYDDQDRVGRISVEIDVECNRREYNEEILEVLDRVRNGVKAEVQAAQDDLDEGNL